MPGVDLRLAVGDTVLAALLSRTTKSQQHLLLVDFDQYRGPTVHTKGKDLKASWFFCLLDKHCNQGLSRLHLPTPSPFPQTDPVVAMVSRREESQEIKIRPSWTSV